eukprot:EG_transcript_44090
MCCALWGISVVVSCEPVHHSVAVCPIAGSNRSTEAEPSRSSSEGDLKPPQPEGLDPLERKPVSIRLKRSSNAVAVAVPDRLPLHCVVTASTPHACAHSL